MTRLGFWLQIIAGWCARTSWFFLFGTQCTPSCFRWQAHSLECNPLPEQHARIPISKQTAGDLEEVEKFWKVWYAQSPQGWYKRNSWMCSSWKWWHTGIRIQEVSRSPLSIFHGNSTQGLWLQPTSGLFNNVLFGARASNNQRSHHQCIIHSSCHGGKLPALLNRPMETDGRYPPNWFDASWIVIRWMSMHDMEPHMHVYIYIYLILCILYIHTQYREGQRKIVWRS